VADQQHATVRARAGECVERLRRFEPARQRLVDGHPLALLCVPGLRGQLGRLGRAHLRAVQDHVEADSHARQRDAGRARLLLAPLGQAAGRVLPASVRLSLCMSK